MTVGAKWGIAVAFISGLVLGGLLGIGRPNEIEFLVRANSKVNLYPQKGDVIRWVAESPQGIQGPQNVSVTFQDIGQYKVPCSEITDKDHLTISQCTVTSTPTAYLYTCVNPANGVVCFDPGSGPRSPGGGHFVRYFNLLHLVLEDWSDRFLLLIHIQLHSPVKQYRMPKPSMDYAGQPHSPFIPCVTSGGTGSVADINAYPGDPIEWRSVTAGGSIAQYSFSLPSAPDNPSQSSSASLKCTEGSNAFSYQQPDATCTPNSQAAPGTYTYNIAFAGNQCSALTAKLNVCSPGTPCGQ
jgi:hypothetical protein